MFDFLLSDNDAVAILKKDHDKVKDLFDQFEKAETRRDKLRIAGEAIMELKIHAEIEEKIYYPAVRQPVGKDLMNEADEEHHVAKILIAELENMDGSEDHYDAKFTVLAENVRHHIKEEEGEMMPKSRKADVDFEALGDKLLVLKNHLAKNGVPVSAEEKMIRGARSNNDSPAAAAKLTKPATVLPMKKPTSKSKPGSKKAMPAPKAKPAGKSKSPAKAKSAVKSASKSKLAFGGKSFGTAKSKSAAKPASKKAKSAAPAKAKRPAGAAKKTSSAKPAAKKRATR